MGGNHSVRGVVLLCAPGRAQGRTNAGSGDVGDVRGHYWCVARNGRECTGIFGSSLDGGSKAFRATRVSPARALTNTGAISRRSRLRTVVANASKERTSATMAELRKMPARKRHSRGGLLSNAS